MYDEAMATKTERMNLRLTSAQDELLRRAADTRGESVSDYVLRHAVEAAETDLADRRMFLLDDNAWKQLMKTLDEPPKPAPRLRRLMREPSVLER